MSRYVELEVRRSKGSLPVATTVTGPSITDEPVEVGEEISCSEGFEVVSQVGPEGWVVGLEVDKKDWGLCRIFKVRLDVRDDLE
jgi:hypothetical protein